MEIREVITKDSCQVAELEKQFCLLMDTYENGVQGYSGGYYNDDSYKDDIWESEEENPVFVVEENDKIIAYASMHFEEDYYERNTQSYILTSIFVLPEYRSYNVGRQLVKHLLTFAKSRSIDSVGCSTMKTNTKAQQFFISLGFNEIKKCSTYLFKVA